MHLSSHTNGKEQEYIENKLVNQLKNAPTTAKRSFSYTTAATEEFSTESKIMRVCR